MLILTRKSHEAIIIGNNVKIILLYSKNNYARIGIEAPSHVPVYREEIYYQVVQNIQAFKTVMPDIRYKKSRHII